MQKLNKPPQVMRSRYVDRLDELKREYEDKAGQPLVVQDKGKGGRIARETVAFKERRHERAQRTKPHRCTGYVRQYTQAYE